MNKETKRNVFLALFSLFSSYFLIFEVAARFAVQPADGFYGSLLGIELPPFDLMPPSTMPVMRDRSEWHEGLVVGGKKITVGDLWGYHRKDPLLGYVPLENTTSQNGWWQSNSIGAMASYEIAQSNQNDVTRILVFGESFSSGSRIPQEMAWPNVFDSMNDTVEIINFAVDGYSMAQSYLRYVQVKRQLDYNLVLLMFVPSHDLWRDINIRRDLKGWEMYWLMPRFILDGEKLELVGNPPKGDRMLLRSIPYTADGEFRSFLRKYDRYYFAAKYEEPRLIGKSILYKLVARGVFVRQLENLTDNLLSLDSEALRVTQKIFETMDVEAIQDGSEFVLIILPSPIDLRLFKQDVAYKNTWEKMVSATCSRVTCIDLSGYLQQLPDDQLDSGYDGTHFGPRTNALIAKFIEEHLESTNLLKPNSLSMSSSTTWNQSLTEQLSDTLFI